MPLSARLTELAKDWNKTQPHVLANAADLSDEEQEALADQLSKLSPQKLAAQLKSAQAQLKKKASSPAPFDNVYVDRNKAGHFAFGLAAVAAGRVAAVLLAGGQGTRLGSSQPKGMYDIGLPSGRTLFHLHCHRIQRVRILAARQSGKPLDEIHAPLLVMTSDATFAETKAFFEKCRFFGLPEKDVVFFKQGSNVCMTEDGKVLMADKGKLAMSPNGNGSVYTSLHSTGVLEDMKKRGVELLCQFAVDNCLVLPIDPAAIGVQLQQKSDLLVKCLPRRSPLERVGVFATLESGGLGVLEYSELSEEDASAVNEKGELKYSAAHICINTFTVGFVESVVKSAALDMPVHISNRTIDVWTPEGIKKQKGVKLEAFIFDVFCEAKNPIALMVSREDEFAPLKNAPGAPTCAPQHCREAMAAVSLKRIRQCGGKISAEIAAAGLVGSLAPDAIAKLRQMYTAGSTHDESLPRALSTGGASVRVAPVPRPSETQFFALYEVSPLLSLSDLDLEDLRKTCIERHFFERLPLQLEPHVHKPKNILITGGAGFIASHVAIEIVMNHPEYNVVVLDKLDYCASVHNLDPIMHKPNFEFVSGDIRSADLVTLLLKIHKIDTVLHLAAQTHVDNSFGNSIQFTENNVLGTHVLLECAKVHGVKRFVHISTDEVYGEVPDGQQYCTESESLLAPTNPYAATKAAAEYVVLSYWKSFKMPIIITRGNNVYGPHQFPEKLIPKFSILLAKGQPVPLHGDGTNARSFLYVTDVARALSAIMHRGETGEIYNIGTHFELSNLEVARTLCKILKRDPQKFIDHVSDRPFNDCRYAIDSTKLHLLGWQPLVNFESGLARTVDWYIDRHEHADHWDSSLVKQVLVAHPRMGK